jgi:hypothetical protein
MRCQALFPDDKGEPGSRCNDVEGSVDSHERNAQMSPEEAIHNSFDRYTNNRELWYREAFMRPGQRLRTRIDEWSKRATSLIDAGTSSEWATLCEGARQNIRRGPGACAWPQSEGA